MTDDLAVKGQGLKFLEDEFVWFSVEDIRKVFEEANHSYHASWQILDDADAEGSCAKHPLKVLPDRRQDPHTAKDIDLTHLISHALRAEVLKVQQADKRRKSEFQSWADSLFFSCDQDGKEQLLDENGCQVMMEWERPYMLECVDELAINENSDVLEIGFGCGYSANRIQHFRPRTHTIIECSETVLKRLDSWAEGRPGVIIVRGTWQERLPELGTFSHVFFDDYGTPGRADREMEEYCPNERYRETYKKANTHFDAFLNIIFRFHARQGTRMTGYLEHQIELDNPQITASYRYTPVRPPNHCNYWPVNGLCDRAVVPLFTKAARPLSTTPRRKQGRVRHLGLKMKLRRFSISPFRRSTRAAWRKRTKPVKKNVLFTTLFDVLFKNIELCAID